MIIVVDNHSCNVGSVVNMLKRIGVEAKASDQIAAISKADRIIMPGVGSFDTAMLKLKELRLIEVLNERVLEAKVPTLGICLGMQLLADKSEEGQEAGLGWISGQVSKFNFSNNEKKIPHMGWNEVTSPNQSTLLAGYEQTPKFYFVHTYHFICDESYVAGRTHYGIDFTSVVSHGNIVGAQFHPEKSHKFGIKFLTKFMEHY